MSDPLVFGESLMVKRNKPEAKRPDWPPEKTLGVLRQQLDELQKLKGRNYLDVRNEEDTWDQFTQNVMIHGFGEESQNVRNFNFARFAGRHQLGGMPEQQLQENFRLRVEKLENTLKSSIKELELVHPGPESNVVYEAPEKLGKAARILDTDKKKDSPQWDFFISHASEDKEEIARPLADSLITKGLEVWYDDFALTLGDSLRESIDRGLAHSTFGIVILSPHFFEKHWPKQELNGLATREVDGNKVILPVWHKVGFNEVRRYSPTLADRVAVSTDRGLDHVVKRILDAVGGRPSAGTHHTAEDQMVFEESVYWKRKNSEKEGPYCPNCFDDKKKRIHLTPGATRGTYSCGVCRNSFTTGEYDARPARRRPFGRK